jgi:DNA-binding NtrC family response regulator
MTEKSRILIVEDELPVSQALERALNSPRGGGYLVKSCASGEVALEWLGQAHYDLLISDLRLPGMNGLTLIQMARERCPEIRSILITAYGSPQIEERARQISDVYLPKPFRLWEMIRFVRTLLRDDLLTSGLG